MQSSIWNAKYTVYDAMHVLFRVLYLLQKGKKTYERATLFSLCGQKDALQKILVVANNSVVFVCSL